MIDSLRSAVERVVLVDAGEFTGTQRGTFRARALFLIEMMKKLGYDAITIGKADLALGREFLLSLGHDRSAPIVSANLRDTERGRRPFPESRILKRKGVRIGITAITRPMEEDQEGFQFEEPAEVLERVLPRLRKRCDVVILLARLPLAQAHELGERFRGMIDVVIVGSGERERGFVKPEHGGAVYITSGDRGQLLGLTRVALAEGHVAAMRGESITLSRDVPEDEEVRAMVEEFHRNLNTLLREQAVAQAVRRASEDGHFYIGGAKCAGCHKEESQRWAETLHAHAFQTLVDAESESLPECYACHVTGSGDPSGYAPGTGEAASLVNVQCEACHDKGTRHARDGTYGRRLLPESCTGCHTPEHSPDFDLETYWSMIEH